MYSCDTHSIPRLPINDKVAIQFEIIARFQQQEEEKTHAIYDKI